MSVIAFETLNYATACVASGERTLAFYTINTSDNGLTFEQRDMALDLIASAGELREGRELSRFENRMLGVAQPATLEFLENPKAIAAVMSCFNNYVDDAFIPNIEILGIQVSHSAICQHILRQKLKEKTWFFIRDIIDYMKELRHLETGASLSLVEFLELCTELEEIRTLTSDETIVDVYSWLEKIGKALKECKSTKFYRFVNYLKMPIEEIRKLKEIPHLTHFTFGEKPSVEEVETVLGFTHLKSVEFCESTIIVNHLHLLQNPKLESIAAQWDFNRPFFTESQLQILSALPIKMLNFGFSLNITDDNLPCLIRISSLEVLDLCICNKLTKNGVIHFLRLASDSKIAKVILKPYGWGDGMNRSEMEEIQALFPNIVEIKAR